MQLCVITYVYAFVSTGPRLMVFIRNHSQRLYVPQQPASAFLILIACLAISSRNSQKHRIPN